MILFGICLAAYLSLAAAIHLSPGRAAARRLRLLALGQLFSHLVLRLLHIRCVVDGEDPGPRRGTERRLYLPNHLSYLDAIVLQAFLPAVFVTSQEIAATPVLGLITRLTGCLHVERRRRCAVLGDINNLAQAMNQGFNVTLFLEGTTSPSHAPRPFKSSLLAAAFRSRCQVVPVCLRYLAIDGKPFSPQNRDRVAWYGDMRFFPHLWNLLGVRDIQVRLTLLPRLAFRAHKCRKTLATEARSRILEQLRATEP